MSFFCVWFLFFDVALSVLSSFAIIKLRERERAGMVFLMSCDCLCSVSLFAVGGGGIFLVFS